MSAILEAEPANGGVLSQNIVRFARALREAGVPLGPGAVLDALAAVEAAGVGDREDFYTTLHAVFVKKHEHSLLFDQAFRIFWKRKGFIEKLIALLSPQAPSRPELEASRGGGEPCRRRPFQVGSRSRQAGAGDGTRRPPDDVRRGDLAIEGFRPMTRRKSRKPVRRSSGWRCPKTSAARALAGRAARADRRARASGVRCSRAG